MSLGFHVCVNLESLWTTQVQFYPQNKWILFVTFRQEGVEVANGAVCCEVTGLRSSFCSVS